MLSEPRRWTLYQKWWCCQETLPPQVRQQEGCQVLTHIQKCRRCQLNCPGMLCALTSEGICYTSFLPTHLPQRHLEPVTQKMFNMFLEGECFLSL